MLMLPTALTIYLAIEPVDMRKQVQFTPVL